MVRFDGHREESKGTKVFALGGKINNTGLVEIPMGTTLREIIYDIGGGIPGGKKFKAAFRRAAPPAAAFPASLTSIPPSTTIQPDCRLVR